MWNSHEPRGAGKRRRRTKKNETQHNGLAWRVGHQQATSCSPVYMMFYLRPSASATTHPPADGTTQAEVQKLPRCGNFEAAAKFHVHIRVHDKRKTIHAYCAGRANRRPRQTLRAQPPLHCINSTLSHRPSSPCAHNCIAAVQHVASASARCILHSAVMQFFGAFGDASMHIAGGKSTNRKMVQTVEEGLLVGGVRVS